MLCAGCRRWPCDSVARYPMHMHSKGMVVRWRSSWSSMLLLGAMVEFFGCRGKSIPGIRSRSWGRVFTVLASKLGILAIKLW
eukprot:8333984-Karenia_brevis.AAC.1